MSTIDFKSKNIFQYFEKAGGFDENGSNELEEVLLSIAFSESLNDGVDTETSTSKFESAKPLKSSVNMQTGSGLAGFLKSANLSDLLISPSQRKPIIITKENVSEYQARLDELLEESKFTEFELLFDIIQDFKYGAHPPPVTGGLCEYPGIDNLGGSCYQNTIYQILSCIPEVRHHAENPRHFKDVVNYLNKKNKDPVCKEKIRNVLKELELFKKVVHKNKNGNEHYDGITQQDASLFMVDLIDKVKNLNKYFLFTNTESKKCQTCQGWKSRNKIPDSLYNICFDDQEVNLNLQQLINDTFILHDDDGESKCSNCSNQSTETQKKNFISFTEENYNQYFMIQIQRTGIMTNGMACKYENKIHVDTQLTINDHKFSLCAFSKHSGSLFGGHWIAYKKIEEQWIYCSDTTTRIIDDIETTENLHLGTIYVYKKIA
tara:strand:+ start:1147 stop:2445 length:1299 start_codon:yes stop_codon:yes gene_type:complete